MKNLYQFRMFGVKFYARITSIVFTILYSIFINNITVVYHELGHAYIGMLQGLPMPSEFVVKFDIFFPSGYVAWEYVDYEGWRFLPTLTVGGLIGALIGLILLYIVKDKIFNLLSWLVILPIANNLTHMIIEPLGYNGLNILESVAYTYARFWGCVIFCFIVFVIFYMRPSTGVVCRICFIDIKPNKLKLCDDCIEHYNIDVEKSVLGIIITKENEQLMLAY